MHFITHLLYINLLYHHSFIKTYEWEWSRSKNNHKRKLRNMIDLSCSIIHEVFNIFYYEKIVQSQIEIMNDCKRWFKQTFPSRQIQEMLKQLQTSVELSTDALGV